MGKTKYIDAERFVEYFGDWYTEEGTELGYVGPIKDLVFRMPAADVVEVVRCKDCKHWRQQTNYQCSPLSFGFCESDDMWRSLYGETYEVSHIDTDDDFYCGYAERRTDGRD